MSADTKANLKEKWKAIVTFRSNLQSFIQNPGLFISSVNETMATSILSVGGVTPEKEDVTLLSGQILILQQVILSFFIFYNWFFLLFYNPLRGENIELSSWKGTETDSVFTQLGRFCFKLGFDLIVMLQSTILFKAPLYVKENKITPELLAVVTFACALFFSTFCLEPICTSFSSLAAGNTDIFAGLLYGVAVSFFFITLISPTFLFNAYTNPVMTGISVITRLVIGLLIWVPLGECMFLSYLFFISFGAISYYSPFSFFSTIRYMNEWIKGINTTTCKDCESFLPTTMSKQLSQFISGNLFSLALCGYFLNGIQSYLVNMISSTAKPLLVVFNTAMIATISVQSGWI